MPQHLHPQLRLEIATSFDAVAATPANDNAALHTERRLIRKIVAVVCTVSLIAVLITG